MAMRQSETESGTGTGRRIVRETEKETETGIMNAPSIDVSVIQDHVPEIVTADASVNGARSERVTTVEAEWRRAGVQMSGVTLQFRVAKVVVRRIGRRIGRDIVNMSAPLIVPIHGTEMMIEADIRRQRRGRHQ